MAELEPVMVGGRVVAYRPAVTPKKTSAGKKSAAKKQAATSSVSTAEEAN